MYKQLKYSADNFLLIAGITKEEANKKKEREEKNFNPSKFRNKYNTNPYLSTNGKLGTICAESKTLLWSNRF
jgi:hypothetical protein